MTVALRPPRPTTANLLPALFARSWLKEQRLSDDGFCDSLATIQLSPSLSMALVFPGKQTLSPAQPPRPRRHGYLRAPSMEPCFP